MTLLLGLLKNPWVLLILALLACSFATHGWIAEKAAFDRFKGGVEAVGKAQEERTASIIKLNNARKGEVDAKIKSLSSERDALADKLRQQRSSGSFVPPAAPGAAEPDTACFSRAALESAIQRLDDRVSGLIKKGDQAIVDLNGDKEWAQGK